MIKRFFRRSTAVTLIVSLMSSTLSFCLSGCDAKNSLTNAKAYSLTYTDTELEKGSKALTDIYEDLNSALILGNSVNIKESLISLKQELNGFLEDFKNCSEKIDKKILKEDSIIQDRQAEFEADMSENSKKLNSAIQYLIDNSDSINDSKCSEYIQYISECFGNDNFSVTGNDFENGVTEALEPETQDIPGSIDDLLQKDEDVSNLNKPDESALKFSDETQLTDEMKELAKELATPIKVYLYIRNNINTEFYSGSRKGSVAAFESRAGNDVDQASLLIAMLRYLGYPAKYATGKVFISLEQAKKLTFSNDAKTAGTVLVSSGKDVTTLTEGGKAVGFMIEQTWVEAYLPYTDYRGAGNNSGDEKWIPLDTSIKEYEKAESLYNTPEAYGLSDDIFEKALTEDELEELYNNLKQFEQENGEQDISFRNQKIVEENLTYLPSTLQYKVKSVTSKYESISQEQSDRITFTVDGQTLSTLKSTDLYGKRLTIEYEPETEADKGVIDKYGSIFDVPAYLVRMVPALKLDGETVGTGPAVSLGKNQSLQMNVCSEGETAVVTNKITAGSIYQITQDMQSITSAELNKAIDEAAGVSNSVNLSNVYTDEYLGRMLDLVGKMYYAQVDIANFSLAEKEDISLTRSLSIGMTGYSVQTSTMFGATVVGINEGRLYIDIDLNRVAAVSRTGNQDDVFNFAVSSGVASSCYEGTVWSELTGEEGVSTMSLLSTAQDEGQSVFMLSSANYDQHREKLNLDNATRSAVEQAINAGKIVTIHTDKVTVEDWSGFGYVITTPETGAGTYMISGGLNGGVMTFLVSLAYIVNIIFSIIDFIQILQLFAKAVGMILSVGGFGAGFLALLPGLIVGAIALGFLAFVIWDYVSSIQLMSAYLNGDFTAGVEEILGASLNILFAAGSRLVSNGVKKIAKNAAKNIAAKSVGKELAEQTFKNVDNPLRLMMALRRVGSAGLADDAIKRILKEAGEEGLERFGKWAKNGVPKEVLESIAKNATDFTKYGDDVIERLIKSNGYVDDIIRCINKYGDDAVQAISKCGDDAAVIISEYGENAAKQISKYGDEAVEIIYGYADDGLKALNNGIEPKTIKELIENLDISPESFEARGIINEKAANQVLNSRYTVKQISSIASFADNCESIIRKAGINSVEECKPFLKNTYNELVENGRLKDVLAVRNAIPDPTNETVMQKVISEETAQKYLSGARDSITGSIAKLSDVQGLKTYTEVYNGLRLDYLRTDFVNPGTENATMYAIRFTSDETEDKVVKSVRNTVLDNATWAYPYTGTGFISSADSLDLTEIPGKPIKEGDMIIPEYFAMTINNDSLPMNNGAEMYKITESGEEILYAIYDSIKGLFIRLGE